jgi:signal transduction histidine kinase
MKLKNRFSLFGSIIVLIPIIITMIGMSIYVLSSLYLFKKDIGYSNVVKMIQLKYEFLKVGSNVSKITKATDDLLFSEDFFEYASKRLAEFDGRIVFLKDKKVIFNNHSLSRIDIEKALSVGRNLTDSKTLDIAGILYFADVYFFEFDSGKSGSLILLAPYEEAYGFLEKFVLFTAFILIISYLATIIYVSIVFSLSIIKPINRLNKAVDEIIHGKLDCEIIEEGDLEIYELSGNFEKMRLKLKESISTLGKYDNNRKLLLTNISHDLKTPLTSIKGYVEGIQDGVANTPEKLEKYLKTIYAKAIQMDKMINDLLLYSKLDLNETPFHFEKTGILEYTREIAEEAQCDFARYNISIAFHSRLKKEIYLKIDRDRLKRVLHNLLDNSKKYMGKDRGSISVGIRESRTSVIIEIQDDGQGIPENKISQIFDRFYRGDLARSKQEGSGLGLSIAKMIVEGHGGRIWAISKENEGTSVRLSLKKSHQL